MAYARRNVVNILAFAIAAIGMMIAAYLWTNLHRAQFSHTERPSMPMSVVDAAHSDNNVVRHVTSVGSRPTDYWLSVCDSDPENMPCIINAGGNLRILYTRNPVTYFPANTCDDSVTVKDYDEVGNYNGDASNSVLPCIVPIPDTYGSEQTYLVLTNGEVFD